MPSPLKLEGNKYKAQLDALSVDGKVTTREIFKIIADAKSNPFTLTEAYFLQGWSLANRDAFTPAAQVRLDRFLKELAPSLTVLHPMEPARVNLGWDEQPSLSDGDQGKLSYRPVNAPLENLGFNASDVKQGQLGDCWLLGSMSAVAHSRPEVLREMIRQNEDGSFTVTFQDRGADFEGEPSPVEIRITADFPTSQWGGLRYVSDVEGDELWPMVIEKAYAKWKGGYEEIVGGLGTQALSALTGQRPEFFQMMPDASADETFERMAELVEAGACITASSHAFVEAQVEGVVGGHLYTVLGAVEKDGERFIQLRNPWGSHEVGRDDKDDGIFLISARDFVKAYALVEYVR